MDSIREVLLEKAKCELYRLLLCKDADELTDNEIEICSMLAFEPTIQKRLEKKKGD